MATTYTTMAKLHKPGLTDAGWGATLNSMIDRVDTSLCANVKAYGADPANSAADNTTAFNAAIATGYPVYVPPGTYSLNALTKINDGVHLFGAGYSSILVFDTTSDAINLSYTGADDVTQIDAFTQEHQWYVHDLWIKNSGGTPASFIKIQTINARIHRVLFTGAASYAVDNYWGYGLDMQDCVFIYFTGSALKFRHEYTSGVGYTKWSFVNTIRSCDFTYVSDKCVEIESANGLHFDGCVFQLSGTALYGPTDTDAAIWNCLFTNCWFEQNTSQSIDLFPTGSGTDAGYGEATFIACHFAPSTTDTVDLNYRGKATFIGCRSMTGAVTVRANNQCNVVLVNCDGISQDSTFSSSSWLNLSGYVASGEDTPIWTGVTSAPSWGNAAGGAAWIQHGNLVTMQWEVRPGTTTTLGTGAWIFSTAFLVDHPCVILGGVAPIGTAMLYDSSTGTVNVGVVQFLTATTLNVWAHGGTTAIGPTAPFTWDVNDILRFQITFNVAE